MITLFCGTHSILSIVADEKRYFLGSSEVTGEQRDQLYARQAALYPGFADYQAKTTRRIPAIALQR
ncbi:hypothetical protein KSF_099320 [Reticulibacter mediterranei]|uniref:Uncharacterized protein n=1 Tax=Reticulibacter mediterranei TaxID=2778369 RepID=A0A8J3IQ47_9CHLR|nr:nitroreductase/quinone reductase family protein [Reticulibacter mediterranei]GHO99884.1 hypothetical protein KSF_099320 [Reticulibacter mediterranei]